MKVGRGFQTQQPHGADLAVGGGFDALGEGRRTRSPLLEDPEKPRPIDPDLCGKVRDGGRETVRQAHDRNDGAFSATLPAFSNVVFLATSPTLGDMDDVFPTRPKLQAHVLAFREHFQITPIDLALKLKRSPSGLKSILYDKTRPVGLDFIQNWSKLSGHSILEYIDDPASPIPGVDPVKFRESSEQERVMLRTMAEDLSIMSPQARRSALEAWSAIVRGLTGK